MYVTLPYMYICENEISNQRFKSKKDNKRKYGHHLCRKPKRTAKATLPFWSGNFFLIAPVSDDCLPLPFHALVDVYYVCGACLSLGLNRNEHPYFRYKLLENTNVTLTLERKHAIKSRLGSDHLIFMRGRWGVGLEDVFGPGHFFFTRDAALSFYLYTIQYVR